MVILGGPDLIRWADKKRQKFKERHSAPGHVVANSEGREVQKGGPCGIVWWVASRSWDQLTLGSHKENRGLSPVSARKLTVNNLLDWRSLQSSFSLVDPPDENTADQDLAFSIVRSCAEEQLKHAEFLTHRYFEIICLCSSSFFDYATRLARS